MINKIKKNHKIIIIIPARLKSSRLSKKLLRTIHGKPMIKHMLDRLKLAKTPSKIIICTSTFTEDDPLEKIAKNLYIPDLCMCE